MKSDNIKLNEFLQEPIGFYLVDSAIILLVEKIFGARKERNLNNSIYNRNSRIYGNINIIIK